MATKTQYVCYDDFNQVIRSHHKTIEAAFKAKQRRNTGLVQQGYSAIHTVLAYENGDVRPLDEWERREYDNLMDKIIY